MMITLRSVTPRLHSPLFRKIEAQVRAREIAERIRKRHPDFNRKRHREVLLTLRAWRARRAAAVSIRVKGAAAAQIMQEVCEKHDVLWTDVHGTNRKRKWSRARQELCYRWRTELHMTLHVIGKRLGGRDHTTVYHSIHAHAKRHGLEAW